MNKYELAVIVSAKIEDDERAAVVDKCKIGRASCRERVFVHV